MSVVTATIKSNGKVVSPELELLYIDLRVEYNRIPSGEIGYVDGDVANQHFPVSESDLFEPGREIEIALRYEGDASSEKTVFKGVVLKHSLQLKGDGFVFIAELSDAAVNMTGSRKSSLFENVKDSEVISKLISGSGAKTGTVEATAVQHKKLIQYYSSDWDFMLSRAETNGLLVSVKNGTISAAKPSVSGSAAHSFELGIDEIYDFDFEADARNQYAAVKSQVWDQKKQQLIAPKEAKAFKIVQGNFDADKLSKVVNKKGDLLVSAIATDDGEAQAWADARMTKTRLSMLKGRFRVNGSAAYNVGDVIEIKGVGKRFSGKTILTGVHHQVDTGGWFCDLQFGLSPDPFSSQANITDAKAAGLLPGVNGLQIGIVDKYEADPDKESRVKVKVPAIDEKNGLVWARLASIYAGKESGVFFWPEPGDEVILGFLNDDPRHPVILGSVNSSANPSPLKPADKNPQKGIVTKQGIRILLDDENKLLSVSTSDKNIITINDKDKFIEIKDANNNTVKLSADGILLDSGKDIVIKAAGDIKMEASKNVKIKGTKTDIT
ncbi:MAG: type VI secretion system tip protein VgrG [Williamsia sp.]|nr:type VI secretion system tip protein VgrG [Williamsia sp.]